MRGSSKGHNWLLLQFCNGFHLNNRNSTDLNALWKMWTALTLPFLRGSTTSWKLERLSLDVLDKGKELWLLDYRLTNYFHVSLAHTWMTATSVSEGNDWLIGNPWWEMSAALSKCCYLGYYNLVVTLPRHVEGEHNLSIAITCNIERWMVMLIKTVTPFWDGGEAP